MLMKSIEDVRYKWKLKLKNFLKKKFIGIIRRMHVEVGMVGGEGREMGKEEGNLNRMGLGVRMLLKVN